MSKITNEKIIEINELYLQIGTYSGVAKVVGCAPSTVKKYIIEGYTPSNERKVEKIFNKEDLPEFSTDCFKNVENWGELCLLSKEEKEEIEELWTDLVI